ncbi:hypothetical protein FXO38_00183 [Capsicum annuum]|uniref:Ubiquitin-like protease family profile domain-containing protein n=1 Tax=Capsicum annuum TaxID=4072 RepID=A0A2G3ALX1_CAPAN|nr:hypothetical protein FXO38_00183 [Capsicum annuum]PHT95210.1 hypothetical protein T459_03092 [Capsicum annuum]
MGSLCNYAFGEEIKEYFGEDVLGALRNIIFGIFLNLPWCNWIGQISKCLLMLEIQQDNKDELYVWVQGEILKFTMLEFAIITDLKCTSNIDDYMYTSSSKSALMSSYFSNNKGVITPSKLITRVQMGNFDNVEDALNLAILFFVHTFMFSQHKKAPISVSHFQIVEDGRTIPLQKILIKAGFKFPISPDQPLKKRKTVMFEQDYQMVMDDDTCGRGHALHHGSNLYRETQKNATDKEEIGVSPQSHKHKSVPSSSKQHEGTSKSSLDGDEIKNYINKCHENYAKGSINDMEVSRDEESNKHHILEEQQLLDVNAANKDAGHEDDFENEDCSDLEALEDVNLTAKEDVNEVKLKNQESTDVTDGQDEIGGTITDSIQAAVDTILFGLSTPSITKSMDVGASSKMTKRHWDLPYSQIPPDFPHAQVRELQASKANAPGKRERKKSRVLRSSYISKYGSGSKDSVDFDKEEKLKYAFDGKETDNHYRVNASGLGYSQLNFFVAYPQSKNWFYLRSERKTYWNDEVLVVIVLKERLIRVYDSLSSKRKKEPHIEIQKLAVMFPTYLSDNGCYDKTERTNWPSLEACKGKITKQTGLVNKIPFDVNYVQNIPQRASDSLDCGVFVCAYAKILSEGLQVHSCQFDAASQRARYASLLWHYGVEKTNEGYTSDNGDPPRPNKSVIEEIEASAIVTLE